MDPVQALGSITAVLDAIKKAREVAKRLSDAEVQEVLLDAQERVLNLKEDLVTLRAENMALKERLAAKHDVAFDGQVYWSGEAGNPAGGPYCAKCKDQDDKLVRMSDRGNGFTCCVVCSTCVANKHLPYPGLRLSREWEPRGRDLSIG